MQATQPGLGENPRLLLQGRVERSPWGVLEGDAQLNLGVDEGARLDFQLGTEVYGIHLATGLLHHRCVENARGMGDIERAHLFWKVSGHEFLRIFDAVERIETAYRAIHHSGQDRKSV